jgi:hypothetical protein
VSTSFPLSNYWAKFPSSYRAQEITILTDWLVAGESGAVIGLPGAGRATLLGFLCHRLDVLRTALADYDHPIVLVPVDLINLPDNNLATLYRAILRSFFEVQYQFDNSLQPLIHDLYRKTEAGRDPFLPQSALRELLLVLQAQEIRVALVMDRFDRFCQTATPRMTNTLRGLRDSFKETLCYIVSLPQEIGYFSHLESVAPLRGILDTRVCWVGPLSESDARHMIAYRTRRLAQPLSESTVVRLMAITGRYPSLIRVVCDYWKEMGETAVTDYPTTLFPKQNVQHRLGEIWNGLTQEEQLLLFDLQLRQSRRNMPKDEASRRSPKSSTQGMSPSRDAFTNLAAKGLCYQNVDGDWQINGELLFAYAGARAGHGRGRIWLDTGTGEIYQGINVVESLQPLEHALLQFLIQHPRTRHTHTTLIEAAWPDEILKDGVSTETLYQAIRGIRKKIEPHPAEPCYLINWRGQREGGYQLYPEGRPTG